MGDGMDGLSGVERTMLLPLWGRYTESVKPDGLLRDPACVAVVEKLGVDLSGLAAEQSPISRLAWVARAWNVDREIGRLLPADGPATVLCLGCGLDTAFHRVDNGRLRWYDVDLPDVMALRARLLADRERCTRVAGSVLDAATFRGIRVEGPLIVVAVGLLYYFTEEQVKAVFRHVAALAPESTWIVECLSRRGVDVTNRKVVQACGAKAVWSVENRQGLAALHPAVRSVELYPLFRRIRPRLGKPARRMALLSDLLKIMSFAVLRLGQG